MKKTFRNVEDVLAHLDGLGLFHMDMRLGRVQHALTALKIRKPPFVTVQIIGTNGKGSTAAFLASLCAAHGCNVGLYTSPHFVTPAERILVNGIPWPETLWADLADNIVQAAPDLTYFEFMTLLALLAFSEAQVDVAILEAGMGGRHDATTAVPADMRCFTPIAMDHTDILGPTLKHIATDKAAAIVSNAPVCTAPQFPDAAYLIAQAAAAHHAPLFQAAPLPPVCATIGEPPKLGLHGPHQLVNAGLALTAWQHLAPLLHKDVDNDAAQAQGLARAFLPGRLHRLPATNDYPPLLLDGAHNPHGVHTMLQALRQADIHPCCAVFSCLADKNWRPCAVMLKNFLGDAPLFVPTLHCERAASALEIAAVCNTSHPPTALALDGIQAALLEAKKVADAQHADMTRPALLTGSLYLLASFFTLYPELTKNPVSQ